VKKLTNKGIKAGIAVIPMLPFIIEKELENIVKSAYKYQAQHILHKHLELKGDQKNKFLKTLENFYPDLVNKYEKLYKDSYMPNHDYISNLNKNMDKLCKKYKLKNKI
jgi:DNA repair photolyase